MREWGSSTVQGEHDGGVGREWESSGRPDEMEAEWRKRWPDSRHATTGLPGDKRVGGAMREDARKLVDSSGGEERGKVRRNRGGTEVAMAIFREKKRGPMSLVG